MQSQELESLSKGYIVRILEGEPVVETLASFMEAKGIGFAFVSAIGAVSSARIGWLNGATRDYEWHDLEEQMEVLSIQGNCSTMNGKAFMHLHALLGRQDMSVVGGHLVEARVNPTLEVWVQAQPGPVYRVQENGLNMLRLAGRAE